MKKHMIKSFESFAEEVLSSHIISELKKIVDDTAYDVYIPTPKDWKCKRKGCKINYKHGHSTFSSLL